MKNVYSAPYRLRHCTWIWSLRETENSIRYGKHQSFGVDGLTGVRSLVSFLHIPDDERSTAILTGHCYSINNTLMVRRLHTHSFLI